MQSYAGFLCAGSRSYVNNTYIGSKSVRGLALRRAHNARLLSDATVDAGFQSGAFLT